MIEKLHIKPSEKNLIIRDPLTREKLAIEGEHKPRSVYWLRRLADGSVIEVKGKKS